MSYAYNSGSAPVVRVLAQLLLKGISDECCSKDITFPANKYH